MRLSVLEALVPAWQHSRMMLSGVLRLYGQDVTKLQLVRALRKQKPSVPTTKLSADEKQDWAAAQVISRGDPLLRSTARHLAKGSATSTKSSETRRTFERCSKGGAV